MEDPAAYFTRPRHPLQRRYEALRSIFVDHEDLDAAAKRFDYTRESLRVLCSRFRHDEFDPFLAHGVPGAPPRERPNEIRDAVLIARRQGLSIMDMPDALKKQGLTVSAQTAYRILREAGIGRLPKRTTEKRNAPPSLEPIVANANTLDLTEGRTISCRAPLLFLFAPLFEQLHLADTADQARFPGSSKIPAIASLRSILALKLLNRPRRNHVADIADDEGFGLWAGLNVLPKTTALSAYSYRVGDAPTQHLLQQWTTGYAKGLALTPTSFNFDFHAIRHYGEQTLLEKNYVPRRSQSVPSILVAFAQDASTRTLVYANANLLKADKADQILAFTDYWKQATGTYPDEVVFDAQGTTHKVLAQLDARGITFITLRERKPKEVQRVTDIPDNQWRQVELDAPDRKWKTPRVLDERVQIRDYPKPIRQVTLRDLGRYEPTFMITNDTRRGPAKLFERYAQRTPIENSIAEQVGFFHVDALSSDVRLKIQLDVALNVMASNAYHWLGRHLKGYSAATAATLWRTFLDRPGHIRLTKDEVVLRVRRFAKAPVLLECPILDQAGPIPWLGNRRLRLDLL
ncbi:MAG: hypothetical protein LC620_08210 [Halobacteriales archaeon]|nr:hypothetical protein [Halobacteriales archaeon]